MIQVRKTAPLWALGLLLSGCATAPHAASTTASSSEPLGFGVIDAHTHTEFTGMPEKISKIPQTQEEYFREFREAGVSGAIAHTASDGSNYTDLRSKGVMHCGGTKAKVDVARLESGLKSGQYGCLKIYLGYVHQFAYDRNYEPVYRLAAKYDVPVVFHTGDTYSTTAELKYADPLTIDQVAVEHPKVTFVIAHCGNPWIESAAEVAYKNPNVYLDGSAFLVGDLREEAPDKVEEYLVKPIRWIYGYIEDPSKLMFGTDWPLTNIKSYVDAWKRAIPKDAWRATLHDNAYRVFHMERLKKYGADVGAPATSGEVVPHS